MFVSTVFFTCVAELHHISLLEKPSVTQDQNMYVTENSVIHIDSAARSMWMTDFSDRSMWMTNVCITYMFRFCVMLGFSYSV
jgi:hypothetical protein